jgi:hypothetical protein
VRLALAYMNRQIADAHAAAGSQSRPLATAGADVGTQR